MLIMTDADRAFLVANFGENSPLLTATQVNDVLDVIDDLIDEKGFAPPHYYDYNDFGRAAQKTRDSIYLNNS